MELDFVPLDYDYFEHENKNYIKIIGKTSTQKRICLIDTCQNYFWAILKQNTKQTQIKTIQEKIQNLKINESNRIIKIIKTSLEDKNFMGQKVKAIKIQVPLHKDLKKVAEEIQEIKEIDKIKEQDLNFITRYIIEKKLVPMKWHKIQAESTEELSQNLDVDLILKPTKIQPLEKNQLFKPKILAFDIETNDLEIGKGEILMLSIVTDNFKKVLTTKPVSKPHIEACKNEEELIEKFIKHVKKQNPDIITGYFSDKFDLPYLKARAEKNKIRLELGLDNSPPKFTGGINTRGKISGRVHIDLYQFIATAYSQYLQSETLGLGDVASELLGEKKHEHEHKHSSKMNDKEWENFLNYNLQDSILTFKLLKKVWPDITEFSRVMQEPLFNVTRDGISANVENYIIHNLEKYNEIIENKPSHEQIRQRRKREKYEGAFVLQPVPKLYEDIVMFDFTSYWPSIIASFNLSASTFLKDKKQPNSEEIEITVNKKPKKIYFSKQKGFFPDMLEQIIKTRKKYKQEFKNNPSPILKARSNAFKLLANASYGYQGFFAARYYCPEASAATTAISRQFIKKTIKKAEQKNFKPIYSDTDSIALEMNKQSKKQALEFQNSINKDLPGIMELELEDFYKRGIWVTTRSGEIGAKKKYALIDEKNKLKIRGFETVRRDWCKLARELQNKILEKTLTNGNETSALEYTKEIIKKLKKRQIPKKELIIKTQLKKPISEYKANTPHVTIARQMIKLGMPLDPGALIEYYIAENNNKKALARDKAALPDEEKPYDIEYYLNKQLIPAVENIFHVFNIEIKDLIKGTEQKKLF